MARFVDQLRDRILPALLSSRAGRLLFDAVGRLLYVDGWRRHLVRIADARLRAGLETVPRVAPRGPSERRTIGREHRLVALAILHTVDRLIERRTLSPQVLRVITRLWGRAIVFAFSPARPPAVRRFRDDHGNDPPWFLVLSPDRACNLRCSGCYADSSPKPAGQEHRLPWSVLDRLMIEAQALWNAGLFVFSGGEPLIYRSEGKDLLDAVEKHRNVLYLMFTNGTLIDRSTANRLARLGNLTPAISVEGMREATDARRGEGVFDRVLEAMARLREAGVPFGISVTVTRDNAEEVLSDAFLDFFFEEQGAFYGFLFHHMPIGRHAAASLDHVPTPEQRLWLWRRTWDVIETKRIFLFDFWNSGPLVQGCVSAGRERGYVYVDWSGRVMPCVFVPYAVANVHEVYAGGGTLNDVWAAPFLRRIRHWQRSYGYGQETLSAENNRLRPCPIRDHHARFHQWIKRYRPEPEDDATEAALEDDAYYERMVAYGRELAVLSRPVWEREYVNPDEDAEKP